LVEQHVGRSEAQFLASPLGATVNPGVKLSPRGKFCTLWGWSYPLVVEFSVRPSILLNGRECSPLGPGVNEGVNIPP
jgi:hypothetical protein